MAIDVSIPGVRLASLNALAREHWRNRQRRAKDHHLIVRAMLWPHTPWRIDKPVVVTITRIGPRKLDDDNLAGSGKHVRDAVASCFDRDDADTFFAWQYEQQKGDYGVRIRIEERV
jgi:hypothetical protein